MTINSSIQVKPFELLKLLRLRRGLNQEGLSLVLNCSQMQVSRIERGVMEPSIDCKRAINKYFGQTVWPIENDR